MPVKSPIPGHQEQYFFGDPVRPDRNWRKELQDEDEDAPLDPEEERHVVALLGFDPAKYGDKIPGGLADEMDESEFDPRQLRLGIKVESEHTNDPLLAKEIAMDHLAEDPQYYTKLKKMEEGRNQLFEDQETEPKAGLATQTSPSSGESPKQILKRSKITNTTPINVDTKGWSESHWADTDTGMKGVFKPGKGEPPGARPSIEPGTMYKREVAASDVADAIGMHDLVPATVYGQHPEYGEGSMQHFMPGVIAKKLPENEKFDGPEDLARAATFDYLVGNTDRHDRNWIVNPEKGNKLALIDNGYAFPGEGDYEPLKKGGYKEFHAEARRRNLPIPEEAKNWKWEEIEPILKEHGFNDQTIALTKDRFDDIQNHTHIKQLNGLY